MRVLSVLVIATLLPWVAAASGGEVSPEQAPFSFHVDPGFALVEQRAVLQLPAPHTGELPLEHDARFEALTGLPASTMFAAQGNTTPNGTITHEHATGGARGLTPVWEAEFYGVPRTFADYGELLLVGTDRGIALMDGDEVVWYYGVGSPIAAVFPVDVDGDGTDEIGFATGWSGVLPSVGVLSADATELWRYTISFNDIESFWDLQWLGAGNAAGDIIAIRGDGHVFNFDGATGAPQWDRMVEQAPRRWSWNLQTAVGDVTGDGAADAVVYLTYDDMLLGYEHNWGEVVVVDGATGDVAWRHTIDYGLADFGWHDAFDITLLDANGDTTLDVAVSGWYLGYSVTIVEDGYLRVLDGRDGQVLGLRTSAASSEMYLELDHQDVDGDDRDEVVALVIGATLLPAGPRIERYAVTTNTESGALVLVSDLSIEVPTWGQFMGFGSPRTVVFASYDSETDTGSRIPPALYVSTASAMTGPFERDLNVYAMHHNGQLLVADEAGVHWQDTVDGAEVMFVPFYGRPYYVMPGDITGDGFDDLYVASSDGALHMVDGITGQVESSFRLPEYTFGYDVVDLTGDGVSEVVALFLDFNCGFRSCEILQETRVYQGDTLLWKLDGWAYGWHKINGDSTPDFLIRDGDRLAAHSGKDAAQLWTIDTERGGLGVLGDLVIVFGEELEAFALKDGAAKWTAELPTEYARCIALADRIYWVGGDEDDEKLKASFISKTGNQQGLNWPLKDVEYCSMAPLGTDVVLRTRTEDGVKFAQFDPDGGTFLWTTPQWKEDENGVTAWILAVDNRVFLAEQDHVYLMDGALIAAEYVVNGPFVSGGTLLNIDGAGPSELAVWTPDGKLVVLSDDPRGVSDNLDKAAKAQGKELDEKTQAILDDDQYNTKGEKKSPGLPGLVLLGLLGILARRRR